MIYLKTVSIPGPFLFLRPSHPDPTVPYSTISACRGGTVGIVVPPPLQACPPLHAHHALSHTRLSQSPSGPSHIQAASHWCSRSSLHPPESHYLSSPGNGNILSTGKGGTSTSRKPPVEQLSWDPRRILLLWGSSPPHLQSLLQSKCTGPLKSKHISAGKCNSRWWVKKKKNHLFMGFFFMRFTFPAKQETFYCNSIHLEQQAQVVNEREGRHILGSHAPPLTNTQVPFHIHLLILLLWAQNQVESALKKKKIPSYKPLLLSLRKEKRGTTGVVRCHHATVKRRLHHESEKPA